MCVGVSEARFETVLYTRKYDLQVCTAWCMDAAIPASEDAAVDVPAPKTAAEDTVPERPDGFADGFYYQATAEGKEVKVSDEISWKEVYTLVREGVITASGRCSGIAVVSLGLIVEAVVFERCVPYENEYDVNGSSY